MGRHFEKKTHAASENVLWSIVSQLLVANLRSILPKAITSSNTEMHVRSEKREKLHAFGRRNAIMQRTETNILN